LVGVAFLWLRQGPAAPPEIALVNPADGDHVAEADTEISQVYRCKENLTQLGVAFQTYHDSYHCFPRYAICDPDGRPLLSWRVALLPFLGQRALYRQFHLDEPWDSAHNLPLADRMPAVFRCPAETSAAANVTSYVVAVGDETYFPPQGTVKETDVTDGAEWTGMVGELSPSNIVWTRPADLSFGALMDPERGFRSAHGGGGHMLMGDGSVEVLRSGWEPSVMEIIMTIGRRDGQVLAAREYAPRTQCKNNLKQLALAFHHYHDAHGCYPPFAIRDANGKPLLSWRVAILPFVNDVRLYEQFRLDEPWDSPHNLPLADKMPPEYRCPVDKSAAANVTNYVAAVGDGTYFPPRGTVTRSAIQDGAKWTAMVGELAPSGIVWTKPEDLVFDARFPEAGGFRSFHDSGWPILMGDGAVRFLRENVDRKTYRAIMTIAGGEPIAETGF
jgi:prepilin-type processing-associated H-X9-DG protein